MKKDTLGIYIHIPFCVRKCAYCDFLSAPPASAGAIQEYVDALCREIAIKSEIYATNNNKATIVDTVFFGGGTPSLLATEDLGRILCTLRRYFTIAEDAEITVECNPDTVDLEKLKFYKEQGVNRISFGLQSACNEELKMLGRIHSYEKFLESFDAARKAGFTNINVDLISAIPGQKPEGWERSLRKVAELAPEHISAYSLILEEGTKLFEEQDNYTFPTEDEDAKMYEATESILREYGYKRYEISNYAKEGFESCHNNRYWKREEYLGFGVGAASFVDNVRFTNISDEDKYCEFFTEEQETLTPSESMAEFFYLGLRRMEGVYFVDFEKEFGTSPLDIYGDVISKLVLQGLLEYIETLDGKNIGVRLTKEGIFLSNRVFVEFV
ncbi:MAG: radical SAM family heme chaperone HemW [Lachnospiraceae bacterium]|nr:radical SAM family heme chaperone HemW [Lachnospiraceae bacterium]